MIGLEKSFRMMYSSIGLNSRETVPLIYDPVNSKPWATVILFKSRMDSSAVQAKGTNSCDVIKDPVQLSAEITYTLSRTESSELSHGGRNVQKM